LRITDPNTIVRAALTEKQFQSQVMSLAKVFGWRAYHPYLSIHSERGFPDLTLVRERIVFAELKTEKGRLTEHQEEWLGLLGSAGAEVYVWRPSDFDALTEILRHRPKQAVSGEAADQVEGLMGAKGGSP